MSSNWSLYLSRSMSWYIIKNLFVMYCIKYIYRCLRAIPFSEWNQYDAAAVVAIVNQQELLV